jgi:hydroxyacylglutathione hydrolase
VVLVKQFINIPIKSNTYVVSSCNSNKCLIIDPGSIDMSLVINYLQKNNKSPIAILLTHEHFDHIYGVNALTKFYSEITIYGSDKTIERIQDKKKNLSFYFDQIGYEVVGNKCVIQNNYLMIDLFYIKVFETKGHTDSSLSYLIEDKLFTGDFLIKDEKTVTKFPTGNYNEFVDSFEKYKNYIFAHEIFPGHGITYKLNK